MNFKEYLSYFEQIILNPTQFPVYQDESYYKYAKLNWSRTNRWLNKFEPSDETKELIASVNEPQTWIIITEPWCGDAAHSVPQLYNMVENNPFISVDIQLRDEAPFLIDQYLTNGGKSIPKLIIRNAEDKDVAVWGPRPEKLQEFFVSLKAQGDDMNEIKEAVQKWYNEDKGYEIQKDIAKLLV
ncbi:thioredoxin family protein [Sphingobacterium bovistauri]|uniref:Thioredoxin family protein n=1 Tax=Sphingobacterium bovistauri TaxID=2781959 RepID=A0ABS7Z4F0_9SPHI|nr:thioredoxin family protein [Sphingobacterium bovistauri]MCA5005061.1 thioredoxin family protein [Sphingobacterium bovistauri]